MTPKLYTLVGPDGVSYLTPSKGLFGGYRKRHIYGRLDCRSALRHIAAGHYVKERVFFADEATAISAGYRPCHNCMPAEYKQWKILNARRDDAGPHS